MGIFDASSSGHLLFYGQVTPNKAISSGQTPSIAMAEIVLSWPQGDTGEISDYLADALLNFICRGTAYSKPTKAVALCTADCTDAALGTEVTNANGYQRKTITGWTVSGNSASNTSEETFNAPSGTFSGAITAMALVDSATHGAGNMLFYDNSPGGTGTPGNGDTIKIAASGFAVSIS